ncbi:MAG: ABC transporter permease [Gemmatimonadota bacterium]
MESFSRDLVYALRLLRQRPVFALIAAASVAIGIGATTVIASVIDKLLLQPPPGISASDRVVDMGRSTGGRGFDSFSYPEIMDVRAQSQTLDHVAAWRFTPLSFSTGRESERIMGLAASAEYFAALGLTPALGRFYTLDEDRVPGANPVAVLSYRFWRDRLGADAKAVGSTIEINRRRFTVVGVAAEAFRGHVTAVEPAVYFPLTMWSIARPGMNEWNQRRSSWITAVARLAPGATMAQANAELQTLFARMPDRDTSAFNQRSASVVSLGAVPGGGRTPITAFLGLLTGLVGVVLLITCANVAGMMIARAMAREREIAIRLAIGSSRVAIVRQLVIESLLLFGIGGLGGLALAFWGADALSSIHLPVPIPIELDFRPDLRVLLAGLALAMVTGIVFGLAPALQASKADVITVLKAESARKGSRGGRMRRAFVTGQIALSLILLASAGLFLRSLQRATQVEVGFDPTGVQMVTFDLVMDGYDETRGQAFQQTLLQRVGALPSVTAVGIGTDLPLDLGISEQPMLPEGRNDPADRGIGSAFSRVGGGYFTTLRIPVLQGRVFGPEDTGDSRPVAVISKAFAEEAWPGENPIGKRVRQVDGDAVEWMTVIGVVADVKHKSVMDEAQSTIYTPLTQDYTSDVTLLVQGTAVSPANLRAAILEFDPKLSFSLIQSLAEYTGIGTMPQRIAAWLTTVLGLLALLLSAMGVYGVIAFMVTRRTREIGTRMALGAERAHVLKLIVRDGVRLAAPGLIVGMIAALAIGRVARSFILGVAPADPLTFTLVPLTLLMAIGLACWAPARRAASIQPIQALKTE